MPGLCGQGFYGLQSCVWSRVLGLNSVVCGSCYWVLGLTVLCVVVVIGRGGVSENRWGAWTPVRYSDLSSPVFLMTVVRPAAAGGSCCSLRLRLGSPLFCT